MPLIAFIRFLLFSALIVEATIFLHADKPKPNVLMIAIDDLNDWVSHLGGHPQMQTPHIDRLAEMGVSFTQAHTMAPQCNPSRAAFFSGQPPFVSGIYQNSNDRPDSHHRKSLFRYFRQQGYYVSGAGKIIGGEELEGSTDVFVRKTRATTELLMEKDLDSLQSWGMYPDTPKGDQQVEDYVPVEFVLNELERDLVQDEEKPFFLMAGLFKPHVPFYVPKRYFDLHPLETLQLPEILENDRDDVDLDAVCKLARCGDQTTLEITELQLKEIIRAYMACVSYTDENVGKILDAFFEGPNAKYKDNTIIVLWSDHGYHMGEKQHICKRTLWNESTRAPYIWVAPGITPQNSLCDEPVDFSNAYATLCDLAGLDLPDWVSNRRSMRPLLRNPNNQKWQGMAVTTYVEDNHSIYANGMRFIRYSTNAPSSWELYDQRADPNEWVNLLHGKINTMQRWNNSDDAYVQKAKRMNQLLDGYLHEMKQNVSKAN